MLRSEKCQLQTHAPQQYSARCLQTEFCDIVYLFRGTMRRVIGLVAHERIDISERTLTLSDV
jgi:hypothetical protein